MFLMAVTGAFGLLASASHVDAAIAQLTLDGSQSGVPFSDSWDPYDTNPYDHTTAMTTFYSSVPGYVTIKLSVTSVGAGTSDWVLSGINWGSGQYAVDHTVLDDSISTGTHSNSYTVALSPGSISVTPVYFYDTYSYSGDHYLTGSLKVKFELPEKSTVAVPEPSTTFTLAAAACALGVGMRKRRKLQHSQVLQSPDFYLSEEKKIVKSE